MPETRNSELLFKIIVIGQSSTGKSCLMLRYINDQFKPEHHLTVGVEFASKIIPMDDAYSVKMQIWDTAGQQNFRSLVRNFYRNVSAVFLVYDITKRKTFGALNEWLKEARENAPKKAMYVLVGTHLDEVEADPSRRSVSQEEAQKWIANEGVNLFFQTSSKSNVNVNEAFQQVANQLFISYMRSRKRSESLFEMMMQLPLQARPSAKQKNCC